MTCKRALLIAIAAGSGCAEEVSIFHATTTALMSTDISPPDDHIPTAFGRYRWELVEAPSGANLGDLSADTSSITITPTGRGIYVLDRWFVGDAAEQRSYHVVVTVDGAVPNAFVVGPTVVSVDAPTTLDGSTSSSPEDLALTFQWRLATRPASSTTELVDAANPTLIVVPDEAGDYGVELRVFDGELWSEPAATSLIAR